MVVNLLHLHDHDHDHDHDQWSLIMRPHPPETVFSVDLHDPADPTIAGRGRIHTEHEDKDDHTEDDVDNDQRWSCVS